MNAKITAKRLKKLRENANLSHAKLKVALEEKYNITISEASLKKYEITKTDHVNYGDVKGMKIEYLEVFADFYNVSADYILGRTNSQSTDLTEQAIYDRMGISSKTVKNLELLRHIKNEDIHSLYDGFNPIDIFDRMLSDVEFVKDFTHHIIKYCRVKSGKENHEEIFQMMFKKFMKPDKISRAVQDKTMGMERYLTIYNIERFIDNFYEDYVIFCKNNDKEDFKINEKLSITNRGKENNNGNENK